MGLDKAVFYDKLYNADEAKQFIFKKKVLFSIDDDDFYRYSYLAECVYHEYFLNV